jgi:transposase
VHDTLAARRWRDLSYGSHLVWLRYAPRRVRCPEHGVHAEFVPWAAAGARFTRRCEELIAYLAQQMSKTAVCKLVGIDWRTVGAVVERIIGERLDPTRLDGLSIIGIDELSFRRHHNYVTVVVDHLRKRIVWVGHGKSSETLAKFFDALGPERVKALTHVTMDLSAAYRSAVAERAPHAQLVFDRFHIQSLASDAVDEVRRDEVRGLAGTEGGKRLKHLRWALLKNPWNLNAKQETKLADLQRTNRKLYRAYLLKESLAAVLDRRQPGVAQHALEAWQRWATRSRLKPFVKLAGTIKRHADGIIAYVRTGLTNGPLEGLNNKTRMITRRAYGFHRVDALMAMIFLCCGGITLSPPLPGATSTP